MHDLCSICEYEFLFQIMTSYGCFLLALAVDQGIFCIQKQVFLVHPVAIIIYLY